MANITSAGIGSGLDINGLVAQLVAAEAQPKQVRLDSREIGYQAELSALGTFKGALSSFQANLEVLGDLTSFKGRTARSGNQDVFTVSASATASPGSFSVEVEQLAVAHKLRSGAYASLDSTVGEGQLTFTVGGESFAIDLAAGSNTLADLRDAINGAELNTSLLASVVNGSSGSHLVLTARSTGIANAIRVQVAGDAALQAVSYDPPGGPSNLIEVEAAADARLHVDGLVVDSASNTVVDVIDGVTLELVSADPGTSHTLEIDFDRTGARQKIETFVALYNELISTYSTATSFNAEAGVGGPLLGDSTTRTIIADLRNALADMVDGLTGSFSSLTEIGLTTDKTGSLEINAERLDAALASDLDDVARLFSAPDGYALRLNALIDGFLGTDGRLAVRTDGLQARVDDIADQRDVLERRMSVLEGRFRAQFTALDALLAELSSTSTFLNQQLSNLPGFTPPERA